MALQILCSNSLNTQPNIPNLQLDALAFLIASAAVLRTTGLQPKISGALKTMVVMVRLLSRIEVVIVNNNLRFRDLIGKTSLHN